MFKLLIKVYSSIIRIIFNSISLKCPIEKVFLGVVFKLLKVINLYSIFSNGDQ